MNKKEEKEEKKEEVFFYVSETQLNGVLTYLAKRPWIETNELIVGFRKLKPVEKKE